MTLSCGLIGFLDDFIKFTHKRSLGLNGRWKLLLLAVVAAITGYLANRAGLPHLTSVLLPVTGWRIPLGPLWYVFIFVVIAGASNGVNLTDGLDGLAAGTAIISLFTFTTMAVLLFIRSSRTPELRSLSRLDLAIVGAALIGAAVGFLWYNASPAEVFMGDTGSMALGGAMAGLRDRDEGRGAAHLHRRRVPDRGALGDDPGLHRSSTSADACSSSRRFTTTSR